MTGWLKQSTSVSVVIGPVWATADGALKADLAYNASGINCDVYKNGTKADVTLANSAGDGYFRAASGEALYLLTLSTGHTDTLGAFTISLSATGYYMKPQHYMVVPANVWDSMFGSDMLKVDVHSIDDDETAADNLESACDNYSATRGLAGTALPAAAADAAGGLVISDDGGLDIDAKLAATNEVTAARMGALTDLIDGGRLDLLIDGIKTKTDSLTFTVAGDVDCNVQTWKGSAAAGMTGDAYARLGAPAGASVSADIAAVNAKTTNLPASPAAVGSAMTLADDAITSAKYDESTAFPLKSADTGATAVARTGDDADTLETLSDEIAAVTAPSAAAVADAVWDEAIADHAGVGSTGAALAAAGGSGDPWATALPGAYGAGTAGKIVGDNLNATVGSRSSHDAAAVKTAIEAAGSHLALIKAKTDLGLISTTWTDAKAAYLDEAISAAKTLTSAYDAAKAAATQTSVNTIGDFIDTEVATILAAVDTEVAAIKVVTDAIGATGSGLSAVPWNAAWDAEVQSECTDALNAYDPPTNAEMEARTLAAASYFDPAADTVAHVTLVDTTTTNTDMVSAAPSAASVADAVWDEAVADHAGVGSTGAALAAAGGSGDPWATALPGAYGAGTAGSHLALIKAKTDLLSSASVTFTAPVSADGETIALVSGDDYYAADGRQLEWTDDGTWPDLDGATIVMTLRTRAGVLHTLAATLTATSPAQVIRVEVPATTSGALGVGGGLRWDVEATLATSEHIVTLMRGSATVLEAYTPAAES